MEAKHVRRRLLFSKMVNDQQIVAGLLAGDSSALAGFYDQYADRLHDFARTRLNDTDEAADVVHDTVLLVHQRIGQLRDPDRFRAWVYAIARSQIQNRYRARNRLVLDPEAGLDVESDAAMSGQLESNDLQALLHEAAAGLTDREQEVLDLHARHGLEGEVLAAALGVSTANAHKLVQRVRQRVSRSMGALLVARHGRKDCADLQKILAPWDGTFSPVWRKRVARHTDKCATCKRRRAAMMAPGGMAAALPFVAAPVALRQRVFESAARGVPVANPPSGGFAATGQWVTPVTATTGFGLGAIFAVVVATLAVVVGSVLLSDPRSAPAPVLLVAPATTSTTNVPTTTVPPTTTVVPVTTTTVIPLATTTSVAPTTTLTPTTTVSPTTTTSTTTTTVAPDTTGPTIGALSWSEPEIYESGPYCSSWPQRSMFIAEVSDASGVTSVKISWETGGDLVAAGGSLELAELTGAGQWSGQMGPFVEYSIVTAMAYRMPVTVTATDGEGNTSTAETHLTVNSAYNCVP
ncbi:MAG: sigma-70 family RNA polymerase sigma factor [Acidimicrobiales bacterium]